MENINNIGGGGNCVTNKTPVIISNNNSGKTKVVLSYKNRDVIVPVSSKEDIYVKINDKLLSDIRSIAGNENVEIKYQ